jgi:hypothetical protein
MSYRNERFNARANTCFNARANTHANRHKKTAATKAAVSLLIAIQL